MPKKFVVTIESHDRTSTIEVVASDALEGALVAVDKAPVGAPGSNSVVTVRDVGNVRSDYGVKSVTTEVGDGRKP